MSFLNLLLQRLYPNDTVLFEVLDGQPASRALAEAAADGEGSAAAAADGSVQEALAGDGSKVAVTSDVGFALADAGGNPGAVAPTKRLHMLMHVFRWAALSAILPNQHRSGIFCRM